MDRTGGSQCSQTPIQKRCELKVNWSQFNIILQRFPDRTGQFNTILVSSGGRNYSDSCDLENLTSTKKLI